MNALVQYRGKLSASLGNAVADAFAQSLLETTPIGSQLALLGLLQSEGYKQPAAIQKFLQMQTSSNRDFYLKQKPSTR